LKTYRARFRTRDHEWHGEDVYASQKIEAEDLKSAITAAEEMANAIVTVAHDCRYKIPIPTELLPAINEAYKKLLAWLDANPPTKECWKCKGTGCKDGDEKANPLLKCEVCSGTGRVKA
jgi:hypothetical protein